MELLHSCTHLLCICPPSDHKEKTRAAVALKQTKQFVCRALYFGSLFINMLYFSGVISCLCGREAAKTHAEVSTSSEKCGLGSSWEKYICH